jgi:hypothetical protein
LKEIYCGHFNSEELREFECNRMDVTETTKNCIMGPLPTDDTSRRMRCAGNVMHIREKRTILLVSKQAVPLP